MKDTHRGLMPPMSSLVLAAGRGRRAGGPKAWLESEGRPLLERQLAFLLARRAPGSVRVSVQAPWLSRCRALAPEVRWVPVDPDRDAAASLASLLAADGVAGWASVHHVDMPVWDDGLWSALEEAARLSAADALVPSFGGRRGHPVLLAAAAQRRWLAAGAPRLDRGLSSARVDAVRVDAPSCLANWNAGAPEAARA